MQKAELIGAIITSGLGSILVSQIGAAIRAMWHSRQGRESDLQVARREAAQWECVARRTRAIALDRGAPLGTCRAALGSPRSVISPTTEIAISDGYAPLSPDRVGGAPFVVSGGCFWRDSGVVSASRKDG